MSIYRGTGGSIAGTEAAGSIIPVSQGGTGANNQAEARTNLNLAKSGINSDITQLIGLTVPLAITQGGTGANTAGQALYKLGAATAAQGALAETALQAADVAAVALSGSYNDLSDLPTAGTGDVVGPTSSTDGAVAVFDGTTGRLLKDGVVLGTAATTASTDYATAAQGALADSAIQAADLATVATTGAYSDLSGKPTLGTAAATDSTAYATAAQGAKADTALQSFTESDPVYTASSWYTTTNNSSNWDTAYGWGNHASAGYLTSFTESDPVYTASSWYTTTNNSANWDTAYSWGNHASAGYLTTESDPVFSASTAASITGTDVTNWNTAYGWGNHASAGYATALDGLSDVAITTPSTDQVLKYNGTTWVNSAASGGGQFFGTATTKAIAYNSQSIAENITVTSGNSGLSAGPITIATGYTVTVESGSRWVIV